MNSSGSAASPTAPSPTESGDESRASTVAGSPCVSAGTRAHAQADRRWFVAGGALLVLVAAAYVLTNPGRIDIIDGQLRYEVLVNLLSLGQPVILDPALAPAAAKGLDGFRYTGHGFASALTAWPLMTVGMLFVEDAATGRFLFADTGRFLFALTTSLYGASALGVLLAFYRLLGVPLRRAVAWSMVLAFASLWWPLSVSTFDQAQHGFFLTLAVYCAYRGARDDSPALLVVGGLFGGLLINYAESYALLLPAAGLAALTPTQTGEPTLPRAVRYFTFGAGCMAGLLLWFGYNEWRFGNPLLSGRVISGDGITTRSQYSMFGNPWIGGLSLLASPGKGILFYSPPIILTAWGIRPLWRRAPFLIAAVGATCAIHLAIVSSLSFFGGDWSWGPRYLVPLLPLCALVWPFVRWNGVRHRVAVAAVAAGILVQMLAVSLDHQRYFFERELAPFFWADSEWYYFWESALLARPGELLKTFREGVPDESVRFVPAPHPDTVTYAPFGPNAVNSGAARWMRSFGVFYLPRPWPLWFASLPADQRPFEPALPVIALLLTMAAGGWVLASSLRRRGPG